MRCGITAKWRCGATLGRPVGGGRCQLGRASAYELGEVAGSSVPIGNSHRMATVAAVLRTSVR